MGDVTSRMIPVILCGGSGTRLWPLSRKSFPKQFVPLIGDKSLLQLTLERVSRVSPHLIAVASDEHRFLVADTMRAARTSGTVVLEPVARNTAAAMALAALRAQSEDLLLFCPADHHIPDPVAFVDTVQKGISAASAGAIVTFGVVPTFPSTAYGYIAQGESRADGSRQVAQFIEKPEADRAERLLLTGNVLWNAGIFLMRADTLLFALQRHATDILRACEEAAQSASSERAVNAGPETVFVRPGRSAFERCRSQSIDCAVMEKHHDTCVLPFEGRWSDVGSWNAVAELTEPDAEQNRVHGHGVVHGARNTFVYAPHRPVVALGTQDLLIIDTPDALLVAHRDSAEEVKDVVTRLEKANTSQALVHRKVARPWGWYDSVDVGERFQVKRIGVKPGASLSVQKHYHRAEHWVVVKGTAEVTRGSDTFLVSENESTYIPIGEVHRLHNPGRVELEIIEVQSGAYLGEDDIVRLEDNYGRSGRASVHVEGPD
jgi:mannose-1-phosphate guanylyltransferase / mannose-6-phosphate isomerase